MATITRGKDYAGQATNQVSSGILRFARLGYIARGVVYLIIGGLALKLALGDGGRTTDQRGALGEIATQPYGMVLLALVALGLFSYAAWRWLAAVRDLENDGSDAKGIAMRASYIIVGIIYSVLGVTAIQIIIGSARSSGEQGAQDWTAAVLAQPFGRWLVGIGGAIIIGVGIAQFVLAYTAGFMKKMKTPQMSVTEKTWTERSGRLGYAARGVVYSIIGGFLIKAAWQYDSSEAGGLAKALSTLIQQPYGPWLLGLVALGLAAFGAFSIIQAFYRRIGHT